MIFVSIAAYRDPQLAPTILHCLRTAERPEDLRFGICWQRGEEEAALPFLDDSRFRILEVPWRESRGACWARAEIMKLWRGEDWFLQVDSHCRFADGWDAKLLRMIAETGSEKPILSTYATPFTPGGNEVLIPGPLQVAFQGFTAEGILQLKPVSLPNRGSGSRPVRARFLSAGFLFAPGCFVEEVPYDPELYFMGEEAAMTVRAYTQGFDLFHPAETMVWHDYLRADARKHWGDHTEENEVARPWGELDGTSKRRVLALLRGEPLETFGLGAARTIEEYEAYAGLSLKLRRAQRYTVQGEEPPNPQAGPDWAQKIYPWIVRVIVDKSQLSDELLRDPAMWCVGIHDQDGVELHRVDIAPDKLTPLYGGAEQLAFVCEFSSDVVPASWKLWPLSRTRGWLQRLEGKLQSEDVAVLQDEQQLEGEEARSD